jgi:hypothetical protein
MAILPEYIHYYGYYYQVMCSANQLKILLLLFSLLMINLLTS